ncbi:GT4 family glycosyltransferase PelF [Nonomuraea soli]|uniref:Glycosyltransferase involved in cell wall biosynthesis n=1 Tax=Nonomuraea soli TaxID=1032476 RepID=A0A7W0HNY0_9ACTN|nr:GT4 family glycosyltransferase PelF [Nonomuraea soli]MBA2890273.1 glycosyltransferase involved in cell wall biosynthesis [Nonomuraea soli]
MKVTLVSEGTYPFAMGGVSVWMDQLIRGMPDYDWDVVTLTVDGSEQPIWSAPANLRNVVSMPIWEPVPPRIAKPYAGDAFHHIYADFLEVMLTPAVLGEDSDRFLSVLHRLFCYSNDGGDLIGALSTNESLTQLMDAWYWNRGDGISLHDAVIAARLMGRMLRPLTVTPVETDIVHLAMNGVSALIGMAAKWRHGTPIVLSEHGVWLRERYLQYLAEPVSHGIRVLLLGFYRRLVGAAYQVADRIAPHSSYNSRWQLRNGADLARIRTMYNGVDPVDFPVAQGEPHEPTIVFMGRIDPLKDLHTLIRAFALVHRELPEARLRMFGGYPEGDVYARSCAELIGELGLSGVATLAGRVDHPVDAYHAGSLVVLTSISEGFPYTIVEAMACGRPVVATNVGGLAEAVGEAGLIVSPRDPQGVAEACLTLLRDPELRAKLGQAARERMLERFTLEKSLDDYRRVYRELVP